MAPIKKDKTSDGNPLLPKKVISIRPGRRQRQRELMMVHRSSQSEADKDERKEKDKERKRQQRANEDALTRTERLKGMKQRAMQNRANEDDLTRDQRKHQDAECHRQQRADEDDLTRTERLQGNKQRVVQQRTGEDDVARNERRAKDKQRHRRRVKDWKDDLMDKSSLTYICTSECRYRPRASMVVVEQTNMNKTFSDEQMKLPTLKDYTKSIDGQHYVCRACRDTIKKNKIPPCNEKTLKFMIRNLPPHLLTPEMTLNRLEAYLLKPVIPFIRIAHLPGSGQLKVKGGMITVEAEVQKTMDDKILPRKQELIPVSLRRKPTYKGSVMEEVISRSKVLAYFDFFKEHNPLFRDLQFHENRIDEMIAELASDPPIQPEIETVEETHSNADGPSTDHLITNGGHISGQDSSPSVGGNSTVGTDADQDRESEIVSESNNDDIGPDFDFDTVLETFYQKTDKGKGISDAIAETILTQEVNQNRRLVVAPTAAGNFVNFETVVDIEEKCFPHLFPYAHGGYLSSYSSKGLTFSNYIKLRLYGIDRRFASDHAYVCFLFHVKESLEIKRSRVTYFRKCKMNRTKYTKATLKDMTKTSLERDDFGFKAFKNVRGTTPYFEAKKKELFSMIRQLGSPQVFFTKSVNEVGMNDLIKSLKEKDGNSIITYEQVMSITNAERNKLIKKYPIDVVHHVDARFRHHISTLRKPCSLGTYSVEDFFYRVEFQQRGSAHIHCMFWLLNEQGQRPPKLHLNDTVNDVQFLEYFNNIINATSHHEEVSADDIKFQKHRHTFSCYKNNKGVVKISETEGYGCRAGRGNKIEVQTCRHGFPKFPVPETTILRSYSQTERSNDTDLKTAKTNLDTIKKFILRQNENEEDAIEFEKLSFERFLCKLGLTYEQYIFALRGTVKQSFVFLPKRDCADVFINNYNARILKDDPSNHDIQVIDEEEGAYSVATYIAKYISKEEAGQSKLLQSIEEESCRLGDSTDTKLKKLAKVLEDTREVSMQEVIFRLFGYAMCSASKNKMGF